MKYYSILLLLLVAFSTTGQGVFNEEKNEVSLDGKYYINMEKKPSSVATKKDFLIKNAKGEVLINFKFESVSNGSETYYREFVTFPESNSHVYLNASLITGFSEKAVMKTMIKNELIKDGNLNWEMTKIFISANKGRIGSPKVAGPSATLVVLNGNDIYQDDVLIGKVVKRPTETQNVYNVYNNEGSKVLIAQIDKVDPFEWKLTPTVGKEFTVMYDDDPDGIKILTYLASKGWIKK